MAVVQISKIQVRRGLKNSGIGVPQLSSAEFAWTVDTQELFIGNGSIAEGAPYVGNTKILTEHDNILDLISGYKFGFDEPSITNSLTRSLQSKLDEYVSILDYGAVPDGSTDCTEFFNAAFEDLYKNADSKFKKVLFIPNGIYLINNDLRIPSTAILVGENREQTVISIDTNNILFVTETGLEIGDFTSVNRPKNIRLENFTIRRSSGQLVLTGIKDSNFINLKFTGEYELGGSVTSLASRSSSVFWENLIEGKKVDNILFKECLFENTDLAIRCQQYLSFKTTVTWDSCSFNECETGFYLEGITGQETNWIINDCKFNLISSYAFKSNAGRKIKFYRCFFTNCGNGIDSNSSPQVEIVSFGEAIGNIIIGCSFDRHEAAAITSLGTVAAVSESINSSLTQTVDKNYSLIYLSDSFRPLAVFSAFNRFIKIDYVLKLSTYSRIGTIDIATDDDLGTVSITDNYSYSSGSITSPGGPLMTNFEFSVDYQDNNDDSGIETLVLRYRNPLSSGETGTIVYSFSHGV